MLTIREHASLAYNGFIGYMDARHWRPISVVALYACLSLLVYWEMHVPAPGFSIGALGVVVAVMTALPTMKAKEKFAWMLLLTGFTTLEFAAIRIDRAKTEADNASVRAMEAGKFQYIFDEFIGGSSEPEITFQLDMHPKDKDTSYQAGITVNGEHPMNMIEIQFIRVVITETAFDNGEPARSWTLTPVYPSNIVQFVRGKARVPIDFSIKSKWVTDIETWAVDINARNGRWMEIIRVQHVGNNSLAFDYQLRKNDRVIRDFDEDWAKRWVPPNLDEPD
jgi:hypothetical protein